MKTIVGLIMVGIGLFLSFSGGIVGFSGAVICVLAIGYVYDFRDP